MSDDWWAEQEQFGAPSTDDTARQEQIARALTEHWRRKHSTLLTSGPCSGCSRAVLPIIRAEVAKARAEALRDAAEHLALNHVSQFVLSGKDAARVLRARADETEREQIEKEQNDGR